MLPLVVAPMFGVSGTALAIAACRSGVIGSFPVANASGPEDLDRWLDMMAAALGPSDAPFAANLIIHRSPQSLKKDVESLCRHRVPLVITSVGSPASVVPSLHEAGCKVWADVGSLTHARKAVQAGVDGLVLLSAGAGGQTGSLNGLAFVRAVRQFFDGEVVLSGGIADGAALWAAQSSGATYGYMGTRFIATDESLAPPGHKRMVVEAKLDDIQLTRAFTGLPTNMLRPSIVNAGMAPEALDEHLSTQQARELFGAARKTFDAGADKLRRWRDVWSAGHSVGGATAVMPTAELVACIQAEYSAAVQDSLVRVFGRAECSFAGL